MGSSEAEAEAEAEAETETKTVRDRRGEVRRGVGSEAGPAHAMWAGPAAPPTGQAMRVREAVCSSPTRSPFSPTYVQYTETVLDVRSMTCETVMPDASTQLMW